MDKDKDLGYLHKLGRNPVAKALRSQEFHQRVVPEKKMYNRKKFRKNELRGYQEDV